MDILQVVSVTPKVDDKTGKQYKVIYFNCLGEEIIFQGVSQVVHSKAYDREETWFPAGTIKNADGSVSPTKGDAGYDSVHVGKLFRGRLVTYATTPFRIGNNPILVNKTTIVVFDTEDGVKKCNTDLRRSKHNATVIGEYIGGKAVMFQTYNPAPSMESFQAPETKPLTPTQIKALEKKALKDAELLAKKAELEAEVALT